MDGPPGFPGGSHFISLFSCQSEKLQNQDSCPDLYTVHKSVLESYK
jgi:hypothetical protein